MESFFKLDLIRYYQILDKYSKSSLFKFLSNLSNEELRNWRLSNKSEFVTCTKAHILFQSIWYDIYFKIEFAKLLHNKIF